MFKNVVTVAVLSGMLTACQPIIHSRGNVTVEEQWDKFIVGKTTMNDVVKVCGYPSLHKEDSVWIYFGAKSSDLAFHDIEMQNRFVARLTFDKKRILQKKEKISLPQDDTPFTDPEIQGLMTSVQVAKQLDSIKSTAQP